MKMKKLKLDYEYLTADSLKRSATIHRDGFKKRM